ncbi:MAG: Rne/Rng family ribonuclease [Pseudomonadota bacterium]
MTKKMLIDAAHPEEVRVAVLSQQKKVEDFDFETASRKPLRGNIFLARVTRVEPSLQAAFVDYGGNRHGFLAFSEIHPDYYQIPVSDRQALQEAENKVADLAAKLELAQRGDEDDDEGDDNNADDAFDEESGEKNADDAQPNASDEDAEETKSAGGAATNASPSREEADPSDNNRIEEEEEEEEEEEADESEDASEDSQARQNKLKKGADTEVADDEISTDDADVETSSDDAGAQAAEESEAAEENASDEQSIEPPSEDEDNEKNTRDQLFEEYKDAKRKRAQLLRNYKIQEVIKRRQILLIQVVKEERGNKGAALTTYLSLAGRYCVLMPNTARGGGISRKIANGSDRRRLRRVVDSLDVPRGMGLIIRTAGAKRTKTEIKRDYDYLLRLWENIRSLTLKSIAPCLIYEEASLIKRAIRDLYDKDISKVLVEGETGYREAKDFMKMLMPSHAKNVQPYKEAAPIFHHHNVEAQLDGMYQPTVRLKSGGYLVIHQTEALVAIDVNSGRATRERNIEQTALKTNIEAAEEAARQFRLRDLAGLVVIDFIDMEEPRNNRKVEKALKEAMKADRARVQVGRISPFGLLELSRQRRRSGIVDGTTQSCPTCAGAGVIRSHEMASLRILRAIEGEAISRKVGLICVRTSPEVALHVLNHHREWLARIETASGVKVELLADTGKAGDDYDLEKSGTPRDVSEDKPVVRADRTTPIEADDEEPAVSEVSTRDQEDDEDEKPRKRRRRRRSRKEASEQSAEENTADDKKEGSEKDKREASDNDQDAEDRPKKRRRRGRRGGRRNRKDATHTGDAENGETASDGDSETSSDQADEAVAASSGSQDNDPAREGISDTDKPKEKSQAVPATSGEEASIDAISDKTKASNGNGDEAASQTDKPFEDRQDDETADIPAEVAAAEPAPKKPSRKGWWQRAIRS